ncbi:MAG: heme-binding protein [Euzebyales bacterium]|nr:heme-binding protein [Euzebyales bacterium]
MSGPIALQQADSVVDTALARAAELGCPPLTVAVLDPGGHLVALKRQDRSGILRVEIAVGKAWGALGMGLPSRELARRAEQMPQFFVALASASGGRIVPLPGGVLIRSGDDIIGAVGISGDTSDRDEECAVAGVVAAGLTADTESDQPR